MKRNILLLLLCLTPALPMLPQSANDPNEGSRITYNPLGENGNFGNVPCKDAIRHSYWNALCASDALVSNQATLFVTTAHEYNNKWGINTIGNRADAQQAFNSTMDLHNNALGRATVHSILGIPNGPAILVDLMQKYAAGVCWIWDGGEARG